MVKADHDQDIPEVLIENIPVPPAHRPEFLLAPRCSKSVKSTGTGYFDKEQQRCGRVARIKINGTELCHQHAGEWALKYLIKRGKQ